MVAALVFLVGQLFLFGTAIAQCPEPCSDCKVFENGVYKGTWNLVAEKSSRCNDSCLYERISDGENMCFCDPGPTEYETCEGCGCNGCETANKWLVVTGGNNKGGLQDSSGIISSTGVCKPIPSPTIPLLPKATSAGEMAFRTGDSCLNGILVFCGGSTTFVDDTTAINLWGATNLCYSLPTGAPNAWSTAFPAMLEERAWFSLTKINDDTMIAVGGIDNSGVATDSMEQYSFVDGIWTSLTYSLQEQRFGHCTVKSVRGGKPYLIVIGGSGTVGPGASWKAVKTVYQVDVNANIVTNLPDLPERLFRPACTISCDGDIFVSGGAQGDGFSPPAGTNVYKFSFGTSGWSHVGSLNTGRWGHVMGNVGASANRKMSVAGGVTEPLITYLTSIEDSKNGAIWTPRTTNLLVAREYAASAEVPANTFRCQG